MRITSQELQQSSRHIILLFDGTSNEITEDRTNVLRLYGCLTRDENQLVWYDPGVGTFGSRGLSKVFSRIKEFAGLALGSGLEDNVLEGYRFLAENYRAGDRVSFFGFSRGAYTARVLAGFIHAIGLLHPTQFNMLDYAYRAYGRVPVDSGTYSEVRQAQDQSNSELQLYQKALRPRAIKIHFLGLWDTVSSFFEQLIPPRLSQMPFTSTNPDVHFVRHALAIDEQRTMFQPLNWQTQIGVDRPGDDQKLQDVQEVWFAGVHGDVGGGYPENQSSAAKHPLLWMIGEASAQNIRFDQNTVARIVEGKLAPDDAIKKYTAPNATALLHTSMTWPWAIVEGVPRSKSFNQGTNRKAIAGYYLPRGELRNIEHGALIHHSVQQRMENCANYRPQNLPDNPQYVSNKQY